MLYKYLGSERIDVLENLKIRFSPLASLNDPFESMSLMNLDDEKGTYRKYVFDKLDECWNNIAENEKTKELNELLEKTKLELLSNLDEKLNEAACQNLSYEMGEGQFGLLSLSRVETSLLMWSHYSNNGEGYIIGLDEQHDFFNQVDSTGSRTSPIPVVYSNKRSRIIEKEARFYEKLLCEKPLEWAYEEEERVFRITFTDAGSTGVDNYGEKIILYPLPVDTIKSIYIGYNAKISLTEKIIIAIQKNKINCRVFETSISEKEYKLIFTELKQI